MTDRTRFLSFAELVIFLDYDLPLARAVWQRANFERPPVVSVDHVEDLLARHGDDLRQQTPAPNS